MDVLQDLAGGRGRRLRRAAAVAGRAQGAPEGGVRARPDVPRDGAGGRLLRGRSTLRPAGDAARAYVEKRGIGAAVRERFRVGYAPARWDALSSHLAAQQDPAVGPGAARPGRRQRARPLRLLPRPRDAAGASIARSGSIGFGGGCSIPRPRTASTSTRPSRRSSTRRSSSTACTPRWTPSGAAATAIVVEGNFDVLALHEAGIEEAVAPMGTALTERAGRARSARSPARSSWCSTATPPGSARRRRRSRCSSTRTSGRAHRAPAGGRRSRRLRAPARRRRRRLPPAGRGRAADARPVHPGRGLGRQHPRPRRGARDGRRAAGEGEGSRPTRELYAGQLAGVLKMEPQQVETRAAGGRCGGPAAGAPARTPAARRRRRCSQRRRRPAAPAARLPAEELELLVVAGHATPSCCARPRRPAPATAGPPAGSPAVPRRRRAGGRDRQAWTCRPGSTRPRRPSARDRSRRR